MPSRPSTTTRRDVLRWLTGLGVGLVVGSFAHGAFYERHRLQVTRMRVPVPGLSPSLTGLRVGLLTDVHHSTFVSEAFIRDATTRLQAETPDLIVLGGDYVTQRDPRFVAPVAEALGTLTAPHGVFAILGNHDDETLMPRAFRQAHVEVLADARTTLGIRGDRLDLLGISFWTRSRDAIARLARGRADATLLLAHDPRRFDDARALGIPAVLAGHTHGGQIVLPAVGPVAARKYPILSGLRTDPRTSLFVSRGIGTVYVPCRVNCPPELAVLTLEAAPPSDAGPAQPL